MSRVAVPHLRLLTTRSGVRLHVTESIPRQGQTREAGQGTRPLVIIGGWTQIAEDFAVFQNALSRSMNARVVSFDVRGSRIGSDPVLTTSSRYSIDDMVEDALQVLDFCDIERAHVVCHSMGGMVGQELALSHKERVSTLLLGGTTPGGRTATPPPSSLFSIFDTYPTETRKCTEDFLALALMDRDAKGFENAVDNFLAPPRSFDGFMAQRFAMAKFNSLKMLSTLDTPTLVLHGDRDKVMAADNGRLIAANIPGSVLHILRDAGHGWYMHPHMRTAVKMITDFIRTHDP